MTSSNRWSSIVLVVTLAGCGGQDVLPAGSSPGAEGQDPAQLSSDLGAAPCDTDKAIQNQAKLLVSSIGTALSGSAACVHEATRGCGNTCSDFER